MRHNRGFDYKVGIHLEDKDTEYLMNHESSVTAVSANPATDFKKNVLASCSEDGKVVIITKTEDLIEKQEIVIGSPCYSLDWCKGGFSLTVGFGEGELISFSLGQSGHYEETEMEKIEK